MGVQDPAHRQGWPARKSSATSRRATSPPSRLISGADAVRQVHARPMRCRRAPKATASPSAHEGLRPARQRYDPAAHQYQRQGRRAGGGRSGLRSGTGDRDPQLPASSASTLPLYQSHGVASKQVHRPRWTRRQRRAAAGLGTAGRRASSPDGDPQKPVGQRATSAPLRAECQTSRSRPSAATPMTALMIFVEAAKRAGYIRTRPKVRDEIEKPRASSAPAASSTCRQTDHMGLDLTAFRMLEIKTATGRWVAVGV